MKIQQLTIYPVKSLQGIDLDEAVATPQGLAWDRRWMWVDSAQRFVTQRQLPALASIKVALTDQALVLSHPNAGEIEIPLEEPAGKIRLVTVWQDHCKAIAEREEVSRWLVAALGEQAQGLCLVRFAQGFTRHVEADYMDGDVADTHFADGYPYLVTTTCSLAALNEALEARGQAAVPMARFRPNIVLDGFEAWAENGWQALDIDGAARLTFRKPCKRCTIITVDQRLGVIPTAAEPLATLVKLKTQPALKGGYFGQNATLDQRGETTIRVGAAAAPAPLRA
ncbi:MOSC N-terminal beta barrel domain-containing protein [Halomonas sp. PAMB 3232]|uniref:MOSC domain-containing protein n=1 Tax=Halomonas sp. PAMB 3232 TaxID=3075221 RepID=UPI0028A1F89C|nr:MOSC N-terminal beta barrel domain-containing protein [Halomonas sp. PAMB 3232]WNL38036.1 MOSC N-terminal beta barrel domain-containing protein [Halomonas sp. PAMB 3232]